MAGTKPYHNSFTVTRKLGGGVCSAINGILRSLVLVIIEHVLLFFKEARGLLKRTNKYLRSRLMSLIMLA